MDHRDWRVVLLGGPSGVGKSTVAAQLGRRFDVATVKIDDLETAVVAMTTPQQQPQIHYWDTHRDSRSWTAEEIVEVTVDTIAALAPAVSAVVHSYLEDGDSIILEGDYVSPATARKLCGTQVRSVFVYEDDEGQLVGNFRAREPKTDPQWMRARVSTLLGRRIRAEAANHGVPAIPSRPWATLADRIQALL